jgi:hypothetical protein
MGRLQSGDYAYLFFLPVSKIEVAMATNRLNFKISDTSFYAFYFLRYLLQQLNISFLSSTTPYVTRFTTLAQNISE